MDFLDSNLVLNELDFLQEPIPCFYNAIPSRTMMADSADTEEEDRTTTTSTTKE